MGPVFFGDLARSSLTLSGIGRLKTMSVTLAAELASGKRKDVVQSLGGDFRDIHGLQRSLELNKGMKRIAANAALLADGRQSAIGNISDQVDRVATELTASLPGGTPAQISRTATIARAALVDALTALNTNVAGRGLFSGTLASGPATVDGAEFMARLEAEVAGATTQSEVADRIATWFNRPDGWGSVGYLGGPTVANPALGPDGPGLKDINADDPRLKSTLLALATTAFLDRPGNGSSTEPPQAMAALTQLLTAKDGLISVAADIGDNQQQIATAQAGWEAEALSLEMALADRTSIDPSRTAVELQSVQTQLETLYAVTARLSRLSLADFLR